MRRPRTHRYARADAAGDATALADDSLDLQPDASAYRHAPTMQPALCNARPGAGMPQCVQPGMQHAPRPVASEYCAGAARPQRLSPSGRRRCSLLRHAARQSHPRNGARPSGAIAGAGRRRMSPAHRSTRAQAAARRMRRWADRTTRRTGGSRRRVQTGAMQRASGSMQRAPVVREGGSHDAARMLFSPP